jgi:transposase
MDYNSMLLRLGLEPSNFINKVDEPIETERGFIYEVEQNKDKPPCPFCSSNNVDVKGYFIAEFNCSETIHITDTLRVKKIRFKCRDCAKTFTPPLDGIDPYAKTSNQTLQLIYNEFTNKITFTDIAKRYGLSANRTMQLFDENIKHVPRRPLPEVLCIDEIRFQTDVDCKYICILYAFHRREIVDIIISRQMPYLRVYSSNIHISERNKVKIVISDMYDGYATMVDRYFKFAIHIVDMFHVIRLLTTAIYVLRVRTMNLLPDKDSPEYNFMKKNWKLYLCRLNTIPDRYYTYKKTGQMFHYDELLHRSIRLNSSLWSAHNTLQDLLNYQDKYTFDEALRFIERISQNLLQSQSLIFKKWIVLITNGELKLPTLLAKLRTIFAITMGLPKTSTTTLNRLLKPPMVIVILNVLEKEQCLF